MSLRGRCPSCGSSLTIPTGEATVTCASCRHSIARNEQELRDMGLVAEVLSQTTRLHRGQRGNYGGSPFHLAGSITKENFYGTRWTEWLCAFDDGRTGWLSEVGGEIVLFFEQKLPILGSLNLQGSTVTIPGTGAFAVVERGTLKIVATEGYVSGVKVGDKGQFLELSGREERRASIEMESERPTRLFLGTKVNWNHLGLVGPLYEIAADEELVQIVKCETCGGQLTSETLDDATIGCPFCGTTTELNSGVVEKVRTAKSRSVAHSKIPIGAEAEILSHFVKVVGYLVKRNTSGDWSASWTEYALRTKEGSIAWLSEAQGHYCLYTRTEPFSTSKEELLHEGQTYTRSSSYGCEVREIRGALPWKVRLFDRFQAVEYSGPPYCLSSEKGDTFYVGENRNEERSFFRGQYVAKTEVEKAFGVALPSAQGVHLAQPNPYPNFLPEWFAFATLTLFLWIGFVVALSGPDFEIKEEEYRALSSEATPRNRAPIVPAALYTSKPFSLEKGKNVVFRVETQSLQGYVDLDAEMVSEDGTEIIPIETSLERYSGYSIDNYYWEEGSSTAEERLSAPQRGGTYVLRVHVHYFGDNNYPMAADQGLMPLRFLTQQGRPSGILLLAVQTCLVVIPLLLFLLRTAFEARRRANFDSPQHSFLSGATS